MDPLIIEIYDQDTIKVIQEVCVRQGITPVQYVANAAKTSKMQQLEADKTLKENPIEFLTYVLAKEYHDQYVKRFSLEPPTENGDGRRAIEEVVTEYMAALKDRSKVESLLKKAIIWYLNFHDNTDSTGQNFPYGIKYLFSKKNPWLLRSCIESSYKLDDKVFKLMMESSLSREEAMRTVRRGDKSGSAVQVSKVKALDEALVLYAEIRKNYGQHLKKDFKFHPKIDNLFKAETPSDAYIADAIKFLSDFKRVLETRKNGQ